MDVNELFEKYSIKEINEKTKISAISLRYIKNREFDKLNRVKFFGFIKILENEFKIDLSDLKEEYENYHNLSKIDKSEEEQIKDIVKEIENKNTKSQDSNKKPNYINYIIIFLIIVVSAYLIYQNVSKSNSTHKNNQNQEIIKTETPKPEIKIEEPKATPSKQTEKDNNAMLITPPIINETNETSTDNNTSKKVEEKKEYVVKIIPHKLLWFKAINRETNKTIEYLTSNPKILVGDNWYIKFGHGNVTIEYNDLNISPNTKKVVRIILKDGTYHYVGNKQ